MPSENEIRRSAREIINQIESERPPRPWTERIREFVYETVQSGFDIFFSGGGSSLVAWAILIGFVALILIPIIYFSRGFSTGFGKAPIKLEGGIRPAVEWIKEAERYEAAGDWRMGLRCRYRALVAGLAAKGLVDEVPGRTTGEYKSEVSDHVPAIAPQFSDATVMFEEAWYGERETDSEDNAEFKRLAGSVSKGAGL